MLLRIEDMVVHYGKAEALKGVSLSVAEGEIVSIVGANGAGKTTLLRAISGLKKLTSGRIVYRDLPIHQLPAHNIVKHGIAHVPAGRMVFAPMTVGDNLRVGAYLRRDKNEINDDLATLYRHFPRLQERQKQLAGSMSGGEQQMLAVARALMSSPRLLLMDEPSSGLSPIMVAEVARIIKDIHARGISILLVEQNARMALRLSDRAYIMELGKISREGRSEDLINDDSVIKAYLGGK